MTVKHHLSICQRHAEHSSISRALHTSPHTRQVAGSLYFLVLLLGMLLLQRSTSFIPSLPPSLSKVPSQGGLPWLPFLKPHTCIHYAIFIFSTALIIIYCTYHLIDLFLTDLVTAYLVTIFFPIMACFHEGRHVCISPGTRRACITGQVLNTPFVEHVTKNKCSSI